MKKLLYLGLRPPKTKDGYHITHYPVIAIQPVSKKDPTVLSALQDVVRYTHVIFTSQSTLQALKNWELFLDQLLHCKVVAVGTATAHAALAAGWSKIITAREETAEGVVSCLSQHLDEKAYVFWPHARRSRPTICKYLANQNIAHRHCTVYDTLLCQPSTPPCLDDFDAIYFSSPSTVDGFFALYVKLPRAIKVYCQGPITQSYLNKKRLELSFHSVDTTATSAAPS